MLTGYALDASDVAQIRGGTAAVPRQRLFGVVYVISDLEEDFVNGDAVVMHSEKERRGG